MFNMRGSVAYLAEDARIFFMKYIARFTYGVQAIEEIHEHRQPTTATDREFDALVGLTCVLINRS